MIIETLIITSGLVAIVKASLTYADRFHKRETEASEPPEDPRRAAIAEKRRIIERQRQQWMNGIETADSYNQKRRAVEEILRCDNELLALAEEDARIDSWDKDLSSLADRPEHMNVKVAEEQA